jgi:hypothetical protein
MTAEQRGVLRVLGLCSSQVVCSLLCISLDSLHRIPVALLHLEETVEIIDRLSSIKHRPDLVEEVVLSRHPQKLPSPPLIGNQCHHSGANTPASRSTTHAEEQEQRSGTWHEIYGRCLHCRIRRFGIRSSIVRCFNSRTIVSPPSRKNAAKRAAQPLKCQDGE